MAGASIYKDCAAQLTTALNAWDFRPELPGTWPTAYDGVLIVPRTPMDLLENMLKESSSGAQMTMPIISIGPAQSDAAFTSLGGYVPNISPNNGRFQLGMRSAVKFIISAWADQALGGEEMAIALAGEIFGCMIYNSNRLPSFRRLRPASSDTAYEDRPEMWVSEVHVEGTAIVAYDAP